MLILKSFCSGGKVTTSYAEMNWSITINTKALGTDNPNRAFVGLCKSLHRTTAEDFLHDFQDTTCSNHPHI